MIGRLRDTLYQAHCLVSREFSGLGVIVYETIKDLPIFPLRATSPLPLDGDLSMSLASIAHLSSEYHDGFHLVSVDWKLTHVSQYFSPPIVPDIKVDRTKRFGNRYLAAQFGSVLPGVVLCGVLSQGLELAIFRAGKEVHFERVT